MDVNVMNAEDFIGEISASCMICDSSVPLTKMEQEEMRFGHYRMKICDDCKNAIEWAKAQMKGGATG